MILEKKCYICADILKYKYRRIHTNNQIFNFMKNITKRLFAVVAAVVAIAISACTPDTPDGGKVETSISLEVTKVTANGAVIDIKTQNVSEFAYIQRDSELPVAAILQGGQLKSIADANKLTTTTIQIQGLENYTTYKVFFGFRLADGSFYETVESVEFTTIGYGDDVVTIKEIKYDGFVVHVQIPEEVKERGNALRYAVSSLPMYNYSKVVYENIEPDMLLYNAALYTTEDKDIIYDDEHNVEVDENGIPVENGASYSDPIVPGQPNVFLVGEFSYMDEEKDGDDPMYPAGWKSGYYRALFDWEQWYNDIENTPENYDNTNEKYWTGYFERVDVVSIEPEVLESGVDIKVTDKTPINACITITPSDEIMQYCVIICTDSELEQDIMPLINNNEEWLRWFTGSYFAMMTLGAQTMGGTNEIWIGGDGGWFNDTKGMAGITINVLVAGLADRNGKIQSFDTAKFTLPEVTLPKPEIEVTAIETSDPYAVSFNIKNPNWKENPISEAKFACNYVREYNAILKEYSYTSLIKEMGYSFNNADIEQINSDAGFVFTVSSRDNETTRLAVLAYNWEGSANSPDAENSKAVCENTTPHANFPARVNSSLFDELVGEWEATAPMVKYVAETDSEGNATGQYKTESAGNYTSAVKISAGVEFPETLPQDVYDLYGTAGFSKDDVDELYEEFVEIATMYNVRTRGFNRLLCLGYNFADPSYMLNIVADPYDLFTAKDYSVSQVSYMFYDFGPKWNLEIDKDGNVWLPLDIEREFPLEAFNFGLDYTFYMLAVGQSSYLGGDVHLDNGKVLEARFPVEVSEDKNTLTIKPIVYKNEAGQVVDTYYPCVAQLQYGMATPVNPRVAGEVVLKRKGASAQAMVANKSVGQTEGKAVRSLGEAPVPMKRAFSMTPMNPETAKVINRYVVENPIEAGSEAFHKRATALVESIYGPRN